MRHWKLLAIAWLTWHACRGHVLAQEPRPDGNVAPAPIEVQMLTLERAEAMALGNNPTLVQASARVQSARGRYEQAGLYPNPVAGYQGTEIGNEGQAGQQGAYISQEFIRGGKLELNRAVASQEIARAQRNYEAQRVRVLSDVRIEFYGMLAAQRTVDLSKTLVEIGNQAVSTADALLKAKEVGRPDVLQARVEMNAARIALRNAETQYQASWRRLAAVIGVSDVACMPVEGNLPDNVPQLEWCDSLQFVMTSSPQVAAARANVARARNAIERASVEAVPNIDVMASLQYDNASEDTIGGVQIGIPIPFHNANQGNIRQAEAELRAARAEVLRVELLLQKRLATAFQRYESARQQVELYQRDILPDAKTSLDLVNVGYRQGEFGFFNVLTAQRTYFQSNLSYIDSLRQLWQSIVEIESFMLTDSLENAPEVRTEGVPSDNAPQSR